MKHHESKLQAQCVKWFRYQYPNIILFSIPNGGLRSYKTAVRMKQEGALSGVPDLFLAHASGQWHGLFIEMKHGSNGLSERQKEIIPKLEASGYKVELCKSFEDFIRVINIYLSLI
jgi:hypothetical protein